MKNNRFIQWCIVAFLYAYQYVFRVLPNVISKDLSTMFSLNIEMVGQFAGIYYLGYTLMHIPVGLMFDHFRPNVIFAVAALLIASGNLPLILSHDWLVSDIGRFFVGVGSACFTIGMFKIISINYNEDMFPRMSGIGLAMGLLGAMYGGLPVRYLINNFGWYHFFNITILLCFIIGILCLIVLPNKNSKLPMESGHEESLLKSIQLVLFNKTLLICGALGGLMVGPLEGFADGWSYAFLRSVHGLTGNQASIVSSMIFFGAAIGMVGVPLMHEKKISDYLGLTVMCGFLMLFSMLTLMFFKLNIYALIATFVALGIGSSYQIMVTSKIASMMPNRVALGSAALNMIVMLFGYFFHITIPKIIKHTSGGAVTDIYPEHSMISAIIIIPIGIAIGMTGFWLLSKCEEKRQKNKSLV